jgi:hypothetical protein
MRGDTDPEATEVLRARLRAMSPSERFAEGEKLFRFSRQMMRAGIRSRHPGYDEAQVEMALARLLWGDDLYRQARPGWELLEP